MNARSALLEIVRFLLLLALSAHATAQTNVPPTVVLTSPSGFAFATSPATVSLSATAVDPDGTIAKVEFYSGTTLVATVNSAPYSATWGPIGAGYYSITAKAYDNQNAVATSSAATLIVSGNLAPYVTLTSPANGATATAPATLTLTADAMDADGSITSVAFYSGTTLLATVTSAPYSYSWGSVPAGSYTITARAYDNTGLGTTSTPASVTVSANTPPTVSITSPSNGSTYAALDNITLTASAADSDGSVAQVDFYQGTTLLATKTAAPYTHIWTSVPAGTYSLTAVATDNVGATATSSSVGVVVGGTSGPPPSITPVTSYEYDANGNLSKATDGNGHSTSMAYDGRDRLAAQVLPAVNGVTGSIQIQRNALDHVTSVTDPRGNITSYARSAFGATTTRVSPDTGTTVNTHDLVGNLSTSTDARGVTSQYTYDALNRLTRIQRPGGTDVVFSYDVGANGKGRLTGISDESGTLAFGYTAFGRVSQKTFTAANPLFSKSVLYQYDNSGRLAQITYPSGKQLAIAYDSNGRVVSLTFDGQIVLQGIEYMPFGPAKGWTWGMTPPQAVSRGFDSSGRLITHPQGVGNRTISWDGANNVVQTTTAAEPGLTQTFSYDERNRLTGSSQDSIGLGYSYDQNDNRTSKVVGGTSRIYTIETGSNRLSSISSPVQSFTYDANGNTLADGTYSFGYGSDNRLKTVTYGSNTWTYKINGLQQRTEKDGPGLVGGPIRMMYDEAGHLLGEYDDSGTAIAEYVYLDDMPVAVNLKAAGAATAELFFIESDQVNAPRVAKDGQNRIRWRWDRVDGYGEALPIEQPDPSLGAVTINLRFPGQQFDAESGLYQNWHRTYNAATGRYIESDPIGLAGGLNTYGYVGGRPLSLTDPQGLTNPAIANPIVIVGLSIGACGIDLNCRRAMEDLARQCIDGVRRIGDWLFNEALDNADNTNPYNGPVTEPVVVVDENGNAIPVQPGESVNTSPNGDYQQVIGPDGKPTGDRMDRGGHRTHADPRARAPHGHRPGVTTPDGNPHLPINQ